jgi:hypothetical protein
MESLSNTAKRYFGSNLLKTVDISFQLKNVASVLSLAALSLVGIGLSQMFVLKGADTTQPAIESPVKP